LSIIFSIIISIIIFSFLSCLDVRVCRLPDPLDRTSLWRSGYSSFASTGGKAEWHRPFAWWTFKARRMHNTFISAAKRLIKSWPAVMHSL
jgi:hypothetical protein